MLLLLRPHWSLSLFAFITLQQASVVEPASKPSVKGKVATAAQGVVKFAAMELLLKLLPPQFWRTYTLYSVFGVRPLSAKGDVAEEEAIVPPVPAVAPVPGVKVVAGPYSTIKVPVQPAQSQVMLADALVTVLVAAFVGVVQVAGGKIFTM